jgi:hypothetical protein
MSQYLLLAQRAQMVAVVDSTTWSLATGSPQRTANGDRGMHKVAIIWCADVTGDDAPSL